MTETPDTQADTDKLAEERRQMQKAFKECFASPAGKRVIEALVSEYYDGYIPQTITSEQAMRFIGQRDVIVTILELSTEQADG